ncbi:MAG: glycosyltransferase family 39 protein [Bdellovibrionales bacterium]|nr:glycosyltransferase family 39 protein [Bdellovibrionales bacterium]
MKLPSWLWIAILWFGVLWLHGSTLGISDDEAYYWALAQRLDWGYAFHPPMVAWSIAFFQKVFSWLGLPQNSAALIRLPAAFFSAVTLGLLLLTVQDLAKKKVAFLGLLSAAWMITSVSGIFWSSWMMVPDLPLFAGVALLIWASVGTGLGQRREWAFVLGAFLSLNSKYSGVLAIGSAGLSILFLAPPKSRIRNCAAVVAGTVAALIPILVWNAQHQWGALLFQFQERHGGSFSWTRGLRAWVIQFFLAGPVVGIIAFRALRSVKGKGIRGLNVPVLFLIPAVLVFGIQPFFSEFKAHWLLVAWIPVAVILGVQALAGFRGPDRTLLLTHGFWGSTLALLSVALLHFVNLGVSDPKKDITNDLRGWSRLREHVDGWEKRPWVGSRYQTASQASVALFGFAPVTLLPRDLKQRDEWPDLGVTDSVEPGARLLKPVYFVADNRYDAGPNFTGARCKEMTTLRVVRKDQITKKILIWACDPS